MAIDTRGGTAYRRLPGTYEWLIEQQQAPVIKPDLRLLDWSATDPEKIAADRAEIEAEAKANPKRSTLLDRLILGEPVVIEQSMLHGRLPADIPPWMRAGRGGYVRVYGDDVVEPADGPPDQHQY